MTVSIKHCNLWCTIYIIIQAASLQRDIFRFLFLMQFSLERRTKTQPKRQHHAHQKRHQRVKQPPDLTVLIHRAERGDVVPVK